MSPSTFDYNYAQVFNVAAEGYLQSIFDAGVNYTHGIRPVINISADIQLIGIGTSTDPYRIAE